MRCITIRYLYLAQEICKGLDFIFQWNIGVHVYKVANLVLFSVKVFTSETFSSSIEKSIKEQQSMMKPLVEKALVWFLADGGN